MNHRTILRTSLALLGLLCALIGHTAHASTAQTISFGGLGEKTYGAAPFSAGASATSGLPITFTSASPTICTLSGSTATATTITIIGAGTCTVTASQAGNATYSAAAPVSRSFTIVTANQSITLTNPGNRPYSTTPITLTATTTSSLPATFGSTTAAVCTVSGNSLTLISPGTCTLTASQAGNANYNAAPQTTQSFTVSKAAQTISFTNPGSHTLNSTPFSLTASTSAGLPVTYTSGSATICTVSGSTVTLIATGTCTIDANQAGNASYSAAPQIAQSFTVTAAIPPTVSLTSPTNGQSFTAGSTITLTASASESSGSITEVQYYNGTVLLGTATTAPYTVTWPNVPAGSYSITAKATSNAGLSTTSSIAAITVSAAAAPTVSLTAPVNGSSQPGPSSVTLTASAAEAGGNIAQVAFYSNGALAGTITTAPYSITLPHLAVGSYSFTAQATSNLNTTATSAPVSVTITADTAPAVSLSASSSGNAPATVTLNATATDTGDSIAQVQFFNGSTLLGTATTSPYSYTWTGVAAGSYSLTAVATDGVGTTTTSAPVTVTIAGAGNIGANGGHVYYIEPDQLGTPRLITNASGTAVWQWDNTDPYGNNLPNQNPSGQGTFAFNLRFSGQYFDVETGLVHNGYRDYDPTTGRYDESDLVGLLGGINTYTYVVNNPLRYTDRRGLDNPSMGPYGSTKKSLCEALREIAATAKTNPFLNGTPFDKNNLAGETIPSNGNDPENFPGHFTDDRNNLEYDVQYVQVGWSLTKTYGAGSSNMALTGYLIAPLLAGDWAYFSERNLSGNARGEQLGEFGATNFSNFSDFVNNLCPCGK